MWHITSVSVPSGTKSAVLYGGSPGQEAIGSMNDRFGPQGASYTVCVPGMGFVQLTDVGNTVKGPAEYSVQASGATGSINWFYDGEGQVSISVDAHGNYTMTGGAGSVSGKMFGFGIIGLAAIA